MISWTEKEQFKRPFLLLICWSYKFFSFSTASLSLLSLWDLISQMVVPTACQMEMVPHLRTASFLQIILWVDPNTFAAFVEIGPLGNTTASTVVKVAKGSLNERYERTSPTLVGKTRAVSSTSDIEIDVSIAATRNVSQWAWSVRLFRWKNCDYFFILKLYAASL